jgi:glucosamine--fructose-6-phosphate aminotransferase (isomerizing)
VAKTVGVVNVGTSAIARDTDVALPTLAGIEVCVASSKAFTCQLAVLAVLALKAAHDRGRLTMRNWRASGRPARHARLLNQALNTATNAAEVWPAG